MSKSKSILEAVFQSRQEKPTKKNPQGKKSQRVKAEQKPGKKSLEEGDAEAIDV